jgi:hypothetical protein
VVCRDRGLARPEDLSPAGLGLADLHLPRADGAARAVHRVAPEVRTSDGGEVPDLAVLAGPGGPDRTTAAELNRTGIPHLVTAGAEGVGVVGPLIRPGRSACLRCLDLARAGRDPAWPLILAQLAATAPGPRAGTGAETGPGTCDTVLAATVPVPGAWPRVTAAGSGRRDNDAA